MKRLVHIVLLIAALTAPLTATAVGQPESGTLIEPAAIQQVARMSKTLSHSGGFSFSVVACQEFTDGSGKQVRSEVEIDLSLSRRYGIRANAGTRSVYYNRRFLSIADSAGAVFANAVLPTDMDAALEAAHDFYGVAFPLSDFLFSNPYQALMSGVESGRHLGTAEIDGRAVEHLSFSQPGIDWEIWISAAEPALPVRFRISYRDEAGSPVKDFRFTDWDLTPELTAAVFEFKPGADMARIQFLKQPGQ